MKRLFLLLCLIPLASLHADPFDLSHFFGAQRQRSTPARFSLAPARADSSSAATAIASQPAISRPTSSLFNNEAGNFLVNFVYRDNVSGGGGGWHVVSQTVAASSFFDVLRDFGAGRLNPSNNAPTSTAAATETSVTGSTAPTVTGTNITTATDVAGGSPTAASPAASGGTLVVSGTDIANGAAAGSATGTGTVTGIDLGVDTGTTAGAASHIPDTAGTATIMIAGLFFLMAAKAVNDRSRSPF